MEIKIIGDNPYQEVICRYFKEKFYKVANVNKQELLEILSEIIFGTKELRYGPLPSVETQVNIRKVVADAIKKNLPIPVLVPWGGRKSIEGQAIDTAEIAGIWQIINIDENIRKFYTPGLQTNIAIEDTGAEYLYGNDKDAVKEVAEYSSSMVTLVEILRGNSNITPFRESSVMDRGEYFLQTDTLKQVLIQYLLESDKDPEEALHHHAWMILQKRGWKGTIPKEQRDYYRDRYKSVYGANDLMATQMLAEYFAGSKVRYELNGRGNPESEVDGIVKFSFVPPIPGIPASMADTTVYYRTVPMNDGRTHVAPWRAKGFIKIAGKQPQVKMKVTSFSDPVVDQLDKSEIHLTGVDKTKSVSVVVNYLTED